MKVSLQVHGLGYVFNIMNSSHVISLQTASLIELTFTHVL